MRVLSLDGGGARGVLTLSILQRIEESQGQPIGKLFDLVVGSSAGGIIALLLTRPQPMTALGAGILFEGLVKDVFTSKPWPKIASLGGFVGPKYDGSVLRRYCGERLPDPLFKHSAVAVTTYDTTTAMPLTLASWRTSDFASSAALMTSAAPTYFPPVVGRYIDGGVYANNPSCVAMKLARELQGRPEEAVALLSVGTGIPNHNFRAGSWGQAEWLGKIVDVLLDGGAALQHMLAPSFSTLYLRIQPELPSDMAMDDSSDHAVTTLKALGRQAYDQHSRDLEGFFAASARLPAAGRGSDTGKPAAAQTDLPPTSGG